MAGTLDWGLYCFGELRLRQGITDSVSLSLSTLLSPSGIESRRQEGRREESPSGADSRAPSGANGRALYEANSSSTSGANKIAPSVAPYEAEGSDGLG